MTDTLLMYAILALDAYDEGDLPHLKVNLGANNQLGDASVLNNSFLPANASSVGFYASAYSWNGQVVISYRGTDLNTTGSFLADFWNGYGVFAGSPFGPQAMDAIQYYNNVAKSPDIHANIVVTGHSLGGCQSAFKFDPVSASNFDPFERRVLTVALASSELAGVAETWRARVA